MFRTRDFFLYSASIFVFCVVLLFLYLNNDVEEKEETVQETVILTEPQESYYVKDEIQENWYMKRAIFIEKIRKTLPELVLKKEPEPQTPTETPKEVEKEDLPIFQYTSTTTEPDIFIEQSTTTYTETEPTPTTSPQTSTSTEENT